MFGNFDANSILIFLHEKPSLLDPDITRWEYWIKKFGSLIKVKKTVGL